jgi:hypothetical protein
MKQRLNQLVSDVASLHSKLILLVGPPRSGKSAALRALASATGTRVLNIGMMLGERLRSLPQKQRPLEVISELRELAHEHAKGDLLLLDNLELLFDPSLQLDPLDVLKRHAHARRVVAVWPGQLRDGRLTYAELGHPEYRDYGLNGLVPVEIESED